MASASVTLYNGDTENTVYALAQTGPDKTLYRVAGRGLATPCTLSIERKIGPSNSKANDKVSVLLLKTEKNATTGTLVTGYVKIDISVPRDTVTFESSQLASMLKQIGSLFGNNCAALSGDATTSADTILGGNDL